MGDEGGKMLLDGLSENDTLTHLNLSCNALDQDSAQILAGIMSSSTTVQGSLAIPFWLDWPL